MKCTGEAVPDTKDTEAMLAEAKAVLAENAEKPAAKLRLSTALSAHLETPDGHETFKIGDVVRAAPPDGGGMKFEGEKSTERTGNDRRGMNEKRAARFTPLFTHVCGRPLVLQKE